MHKGIPCLVINMDKDDVVMHEDQVSRWLILAAFSAVDVKVILIFPKDLVDQQELVMLLRCMVLSVCVCLQVRAATRGRKRIIQGIANINLSFLLLNYLGS